MSERERQDLHGPRAPGAHFLNNVLAAVASYVDEDAALARELLADLGAYLAYRLRDDLDPVALGDEVDFVRTYLRLEHGRFAERLETVVHHPPGDVDVTVRPLAIQEPLQDVLSRRLRDRAAPQRVAVRVAEDAGSVRLDFSDLPDGGAPERLVVELGPR